jgi:signal transduction histidine kinase
VAGDSRWWGVVLTRVATPDGAPERLLAVSRDITEQKAHEAELARRDAELLRHAALQQELLDIVSQDLRNRLQVIQAASQRLLPATADPAAVLDAVARIRTTTDAAIRVVEDLLDAHRTRLEREAPLES